MQLKPFGCNWKELRLKKVRAVVFTYRNAFLMSYGVCCTALYSNSFLMHVRCSLVLCYAVPCAGWAIFTTLCCCCVCGLAGIYYSVRASAAARRMGGGEEASRAKARELQRRAKCCVKAGVFSGAVVMLALALLYVCLMLFLFHTNTTSTQRQTRNNKKLRGNSYH